MDLREKLAELRDGPLPWYDIQVTFILNPLNWQLEHYKGGYGVDIFKVGPLSVMVIHGG